MRLFHGGILAWLMVICPVLANAETMPRIAIVMDDIGYQAGHDRDTLDLDRRVAIAIIPEAPAASSMARRARLQGREILIHLPLAALYHDSCEPTLTCIGMDWTADRMQRHLTEALDRVEGAVGINNHQGSRFTRDRQAVGNLVTGIDRLARDRNRTLFVLDSRTAPDTVLEYKALKAGLPAMRRHVFLDHSDDPEQIRLAWQDLLALARHHGSAIAIGHPRHHTVRFLQQALPLLEEEGIRLVPVSTLTRQRGQPSVPRPLPYTSAP